MNRTTRIVRAGLAAVLFAVGPVVAMAASESTAASTSTAPKTVTSTPPALKKVVKIIGNSETKKCHKPNCQFVKQMSKENRVEFTSLADAKKAGYEPCQVCLGSKPLKKAVSSSVQPAVKPQAPTVKTQ